MLKTTPLPLVLFACLICLAGCEITPRVATKATAAQQEADNDGFVPLFNGKDLTGWTPKFTGSEAGVNYKDTFVVKDGLLTIDYSNWDTFNGEFGHLFYEKPYSHYILRVEYRFIGEQVNNGPGWAFRNSGVMLHGQTIETMGLNQQFPTSVEVQTLGQPDGAERDRSTANVCTPGTNVVYEGKLNRNHCISSSSDTFRGDQWVMLELEVRGSDKMIFRVNGEPVFELEQPQLDPGDNRDDSAAQKRIDAQGGELLLGGGTISLQAESHPVQYRKVEIKVLDE